MRTCLIALSLLASTTALAQPAPPAPPGAAYGQLVPMERHGLFGGFGAYGGNISCDGGDCGDGFRESGGANGHIGYMLTPRFGLLFDIWAMSSSKNNTSITFAMATVNARLWLTPHLWVQGGVGNGHAIVRVGIFEADSDDVPVGELAAGLELVRGRGWALDVTARVAQGTSTDEAGNDATTGRAAGIGASVSFFQRRPAAGAY
jgi:hypothetical protein